MKTVSSRGPEVAELIRDRMEFKTYGAMNARWHNWPMHGYLNEEEQDTLRQHTNGVKSGEMYVVYSYFTPIAWWTKRHGWHKVEQKFSVTTSKHQGKLYLIDAA